jgi:serine/threonine-protein kinase RsbW
MGCESTVRLDVHSGFDVLDVIQAVGDHMARRAGLDDESVHWCGVAVRESVINAIKHGNGGDREKRVFVQFTVAVDADLGGMAVTVRDEGRGFDPDALPDPLSPENLLKSSGRGIFLMRNFMDEITLRRAPQGGMEVFMMKRASTPSCQTPSC